MISILAVLHLIGLLIAGTAFVAWLFRARGNAEIIGASSHEYGTPWLITGWIIPVASLWIPRRIIIDIWKGSASADLARRPSALITLWWTCYLAGAIGGNLLTTVLSKEHAPKAVVTVYALMSVLEIAAAVMAGLLIWRIVALQNHAGNRIATVIAGDDPTEQPARARPTWPLKPGVTIALAFGGMLVLGVLFQVTQGRTSPQHINVEVVEQQGYGYATMDSGLSPDDCDKESHRRYSDETDAIAFATGCLNAQADSLVKEINTQPAPSGG
jgi:hypothetical protein